MYRQIAAALDAAISRADVDDIGRMVWRALGAGAITDDEAEQLGARVAARQKVGQRAPQARCRGSGGRGQRSPDRARSIARRRLLAASGGMPPALAARFTLSMLAVLRIVADEVRDHGLCDRCLAELAARAGVSRTTVRVALAEARRLGLIVVTERRRRGQRSLTNVVRISSAEWTAWIKVGTKNRAPRIGLIKQGVGTACTPPVEGPKGLSNREVARSRPDRAGPEAGSRLQPTSRRHQGRAAAS